MRSESPFSIVASKDSLASAGGLATDCRPYELSTEEIGELRRNQVRSLK